MFPDNSFDLTPFKPLSYKALVHSVLIPEATVLLIQQDLALGRVDAETTLRNSQQFGHIFHSSPDDLPIIQELVTKTTAIVRKEAARYNLYTLSGSALGFNEWIHEQEQAEKEFQVKREEESVELLGTEGMDADTFREMFVDGKVVLELLDD
jgi:hypothetical protein